MSGNLQKSINFADDTKAPSSFKGGAAAALNRSTADGKVIDDDETGIVRNPTEVERQSMMNFVKAGKIVESLPEDYASVPDMELYLPEMLKDAVFVGHLVTDLDSIAGAIGGAALYGGKPARASKVNSETQFALDYWNMEKPPKIEDVLKEDPDSDICLVDHQQSSQMNPAIRADKVVGIIDHHALQSQTLVTDVPVYIDIRPWGSMAAIIAHTYVIHSRRPPKGIAGMLLCAILSDTLNLQGPTTSDWDRLMVSVLAEMADVDDIQLLAQKQFKAKSQELAGLSAHALVNGDAKTFSFKASGFVGSIYFSVVETTDDDIILDRTSELLPEMLASKEEKGVDMIFLAVVNIVKLKSKLLICDHLAESIAIEAFGGEISCNGTLMDLGNRVSRKKEYIPVITSVINDGWTKPASAPQAEWTVKKLGRLEVDPSDQVQRRGSTFIHLNPMDQSTAIVAF